MRIAFFVNAFPMMSEAFIANSAAALMEQGHQVDIFGLGNVEPTGLSVPEVSGLGLAEAAVNARWPKDAAERWLNVPSALAGMIEASRLAVGQADIGANMPLDAIAVVIIGGTSLFGGEGAVWRTVVGLLILGAITNLFYSLAIDSNVQLVAKGMIVIGAVAIDVWSRSR